MCLAGCPARTATAHASLPTTGPPADVAATNPAQHFVYLLHMFCMQAGGGAVRCGAVLRQKHNGTVVGTRLPPAPPAQFIITHKAPARLRDWTRSLLCPAGLKAFKFQVMCIRKFQYTVSLIQYIVELP
ncbi:hypothetical protein J6590_023748 [Homalodisca vitripennis]|nr:hypothetical protein J6590_023748 [Homalodisca vitripennis]